MGELSCVREFVPSVVCLREVQVLFAFMVGERASAVTLVVGMYRLCFLHCSSFSLGGEGWNLFGPTWTTGKRAARHSIASGGIGLRGGGVMLAVFP